MSDDVGMTVRGFDSFQGHIDGLKISSEKAKDKTLALAAQALAGTWKEWTSGPRSARRIGVRSNFLRGSIQPKPIRGGWMVSTQARYALAHEFGVPSRGLPERPHMRPALLEAEPIMFRIFKGQMEAAANAAEKAGHAHRSAVKAIIGAQGVRGGGS